MINRTAKYLLIGQVFRVGDIEGYCGFFDYAQMLAIDFELIMKILIRIIVIMKFEILKYTQRDVDK